MMAILILVAMGILACSALAAWIVGIRMSYRIERMRQPGMSKGRRLFTNIFASAFLRGDDADAVKAEQAKLRRTLGVSIIFIAVMGALSFALPLTIPPRAAQQAAPAAPPPGPTFLAYTRSNQDRSLPERVLVRIVEPGELRVAKMVAACTDAAYVTAFFDPKTGEATRLVGGRLERDATQRPVAWLDVDPESRRIDVRVGRPDSGPVETHAAPPAPLRVYDFDLAEFALFGPRTRTDFSFGLVMAWPEGDGPMLQVLGPAYADFLYSSQDAELNHWRISGEAFDDPRAGDRGGEMITDAVHGYVVEARFGRPNHPGYDNFMLRLDRAIYGEDGQAAWLEALEGHWRNCPPAAPAAAAPR